MLTRPALSKPRTIIRAAILSLAAALLSVSCDGAKDPIAPAPTVSGKVTSSVTGTGVAGAEVHIGAVIVTTDADGRFQVTDFTAGEVMVRCSAQGFMDFETTIILGTGDTTYNIGLSRIEVFEFGDFALYVPAGADVARSIIVAFGGPDTRGFATAKPMGAPVPSVEVSLQALGQDMRSLASTHRLAVLGTSRTAMPNKPESDQIIREAVATAAVLSGRAELPKIPVLLYGMSGGAPQASGFAVRNSASVAGLFLKVPASVSSVTTGPALEVPAYMVLAETDAFVDNATLTAAFEGNRKARALWALAREPGVIHHSLTPAQRQLTINWMRTILSLRLPADPSSGRLRTLEEDSGWFGNRVTGEIISPEDRGSAGSLAASAFDSWFPSEATAREWKTFVAPRPASIVQ